MPSLGRDTPKDISDSPDWTKTKRGGDLSFDRAEANMQDGVTKDDHYIRMLAREAWDSSTNWLNAGRRAAWSDSLRAFQNLHPSNSKYLSTDYRYRSRLFRPKTRTMVRKAEAQTAAAFFGNEDCVNITAQDDDNPKQRASAAILKSLLQYRLSKTIPWFLTICGARQDCEVMGICVAKAYWKFQEKYKNTESRPQLNPQTGLPAMGHDGQPIDDYFDIYETHTDHPWVDLLSPENVRFDPGADWRNPVATSPYFIECIPMYICDVKAKMESGEWYTVSDGALRNATDLDDDVTRRSREQGRIPGKDNDAWKPRDYDICWVRENTLKIDGEDIHSYTLAGGGLLLSKPQPLKEVYLQGIRPWVVGTVMPEAHKTYPTSKVELVKDLQQQTNDIGNLRLDNVKLALNPRQFVRDGKGVDPNDVRSFQPGKIVMVKDPDSDIKWDRPPDVTAGGYQEQDRVNMDFDELTGDVSINSVQANKGMAETVGNMTMMQGNASQVGEYEQRVFAETVVEPLLEQLVKLEQAYETDPVVLAMAGREAQLLQKFGINEITDELLQQELTTKVNVGLGATNPRMKLQNFLTATQAVGQIFGPAAAINANPIEVIKEVFGLCGYKDGDRFFMPGSDIHGTMQQLAQQHAAGKNGGKDQASQQHEEQMAQQAEQQRQAQEHQVTMQELQLKYGLEEQKMEKQTQLEERKFQFQMQLEREKLSLTHQHKQLELQHQQGATQESNDHQMRMKFGVAPGDKNKELQTIVQTMHHLMGHNQKHSEALTNAITDLAKAHRAKRRTKAVRDNKGSIIGSESMSLPE